MIFFIKLVIFWDLKKLYLICYVEFSFDDKLCILLEWKFYNKKEINLINWNIFYIELKMIIKIEIFLI